MAGRKPAISHEEVYNVIVNFEIFQESALKKKGDNVWIEISNALSNIGKITPLNLFLMLYHDRNNLKTRYLKMKSIEEVVFDETSYSITDDDEIEESPSETKKGKIIEFKIEFQSEVWNKIKPIKKVNKDGESVKTLQAGWTDVFVKALWNAKKLPCTYNFKHHAVDVGDIYVKICGYCDSCMGILIAKSYVEPKENEKVTFVVEVTDSMSKPHSATRKLFGPERAAVKKQLLLKKPKQWQRGKVGNEMVMGIVRPPFLYKLGQFQQTKQNAVNEELGIKKRQDILQSLVTLKTHPLYASFIRQIGFDQFYVMYWSAQQINLNNEFLNVVNNPLSIGATGSVTFKVKRPDGNSHHILLTMLVTHLDNNIVPLAQVLSERNDTNFLHFWLTDWLRSGAKTPRTIILNRGRALLNAVSLALNQMSYSEYNNYCLLLLYKRGSKDRINTQIRIDIAHLINCVTRWKCFEKSAPVTKDLYTRCVGLMSTVNNINDFNKIIKAVITIAKSKYSDKKCQSPQSIVIEAIRTFDIKNLSTKHSTSENFHEDITDRLDEVDNCFMSKFIEEHVGAIDFDTSGSEVINYLNTNDFHLPQLVGPFCNLCKEFPSWSNVMHSIFGNCGDGASSARSKTYFGQIKNTLLDNSLPIRADKFIAKHCRQINIDMILIKSKTDNISKTCFIKKAKDIKTDINEEEKCCYARSANVTDNEDTIDNLEVEVKEDCVPEVTIREKYVSAEPVIPSLLQKRKGLQNKRGKTTRSNIKNGNCMQSITVFGNSLQFRNTCAFDSTLEIVSSAFITFPAFNSVINRNKKDSEENYECFLSTIIHYANNGADKLSYLRRAYHLQSMYECRNHIVDCFSSIIDVIEKLMTIPSYIEISNCITCGVVDALEKHVVPIPNINVILQNYRNLEEQLKIYFQDKLRYCPGCNNLKYTTSVPHSYLCIDTDVAYTAEGSTLTTLDQLPTNLAIKEQRFLLCGVAELIKSHYIAYVRNLRGTWQKRNDLVDRRINLTPAEVRKKGMMISYLFYVNTNELEDQINFSDR